MRGFVWQAVRLATLVASIVLARLFSPGLAVWIDREFAVTDVAARALAWFAIALGTFVVGTILAHLLRGGLARLKLQSYDRLLGGLFGAVKAGAIVVVAVLLLSHLRGVEPLQDALARSHSARASAWVVTRVTPLFPEDLREQIAEWWEEIRAAIPDAATGDAEESEGR